MPPPSAVLLIRDSARPYLTSLFDGTIFEELITLFFQGTGRALHNSLQTVSPVSRARQRRHSAEGNVFLNRSLVQYPICRWNALLRSSIVPTYMMTTYMYRGER